MLSYIEKQLLGSTGTWHRESQVLIPEKMISGRSVILIHGFIGSPFDLKPVADYLVRQGFKTVIPLMKGQSFKTSLSKRHQYSKSFYVEWLTSIIEKEHEKTGYKPFLGGFSMGGALSTIAAAQGTVKKLVLIAPFYKLTNTSDNVWQVSRKIAPVLPFLPKLSKGRINLEKGYRQYAPGSYLISLKAFNVLGELAMTARHAASKIDVPVKIFLSDNDQVADSHMTRRVFGMMSNAQFVYENRANHILTYDYGADRMISSIGKFLLNRD